MLRQANCPCGQAISQAALDAQGATITFDAGLTSSAPRTINLTGFNAGTDTNGTGPSAFLISSFVEIVGPEGTNGITITAGTSATPFRLFSVSGHLRLRNLTISGGHAIGGNGGPGGGGGAGMGGAIHVKGGTLEVINCTFVANVATGGNGTAAQLAVYGGGGGLAGSGDSSGSGGAPNAGTPGIPSMVGGYGGGGAGMPSRGGGGGVGGGGGSGQDYGGIGGIGGGAGSGAAGPTGNAGISVFGGGSGDSRGGGGGAGLGGAIFSWNGLIAIVNSTFVQNIAEGGSGAAQAAGGYGAAIFVVDGTAVINHASIASNVVRPGLAGDPPGATSSGSIFLYHSVETYSWSVANSIVATTNGGLDFTARALDGGTLSVSGQANVVPNSSGIPAGVITSNSDPQLGVLAPNGGPTWTLMPDATSPVTDIVPTSGGTCWPRDQRGIPRPWGSGCDAGAVERSDVLFMNGFDPPISW